MVKVYLWKTYVKLRDGSRLLAYELGTLGTPYKDKELIMAMNCSDPIKDRLIDSGETMVHSV